MSALHERGISGTLALSLCLSFAAPPLATAQTTPFELGIAGSAKILCSALFVSGRDLDEAVENGAFNVELITAEQARRVTRIEVDSAGRAVSLTTDEGLTRRARYYGDQGCVILPRGRADVFFEPVQVGTELPPPGRTDWPMGDRLSDPNSVTPTLRQALDQAGDIAFESPETETVAFLVVHDGELVYERYADEVTPDMPLESWSMGKSIMATLIGVMIQQGDFRLFDPAPVPEWQGPDDARRAIRVADLLRMSSGLGFSGGNFDPNAYTADEYPDHIMIYTGAIDAAALSVNAPAEHPPNTVGRYRNSDPLSLVHIMRTTLESRGEEYLSWPQRALFDRIGARHFVLEPDPFGNFLITGYDYGSARDWARLGLLYLWEGDWMGERIIPKDFVEFVQEPAPAWNGGVYGGLFWLNRGARRFAGLPDDTYYMAGSGGNRVVIIPSLRLVLVRMGHTTGQAAAGAKGFPEMAAVAHTFGYRPPRP